METVLETLPAGYQMQRSSRAAYPAETAAMRKHSSSGVLHGLHRKHAARSAADATTRMRDGIRRFERTRTAASTPTASESNRQMDHVEAARGGQIPVWTITTRNTADPIHANAAQATRTLVESRRMVTGSTA